MSRRGLSVTSLLLVILLAGCQTTPPRPAQTVEVDDHSGCIDCPDASAEPTLADPASTALSVPSATTTATPTDAEPAAVAPIPPEVPAWQLLQQGLQPTLCELPQVRHWRQRYLGRPDTFGARLSEFAPLLDYVSREVAARELPLQFALIPMVESSYYGFPGRGNGPAGIWQLMPATARALGLRVDGNHDDRLDPVRSTHAALNYLMQLQTQFGDDPDLSLAAYNAGDGRLRRALRGSGSSDPRLAPLPRTTLLYLDKVEALACLFKNPEANGWSLPPLPPESRLEIVVLPFAADAVRLAEALGLPVDSFRRYNGALRGPQARPAGHAWLVPAQRVPETARVSPQLVAAEFAQSASAPRPPIHVVRSGDNLWTLARRYDLRLDDLRRWNGLRPNAVLSIGQRLKLAP